MRDGDVLLVSRPGGLLTPVGQGPSWATLAYIFWHEMRVETDGCGRYEIYEAGAPALFSPVSGMYQQYETDLEAL